MLAGAYLLGLSGCGQESGEQSGVIQIPDASTDLPDGDVNFRLADSGDTKTRFWEEFASAYQEKHSNITFNYDALPIEDLGETIPLGIRNESAHDIFMLVPPFTSGQAVQDGWIASLDDVVPDFEEWKSAFPSGVFLEGVTDFNGKTYILPPTTAQRNYTLLLYNRELMEEAGYDPSSEPLTWDEYRDAARKITEQGDGSTYGVVIEGGQPPRLELWVNNLAHMAGAASVGSAGGYIDPKSGEYNYTSDEVLGAIELLMALKSDGSIFPGSSSLLGPEAWPRVPQGNAGMVTAGPWVIVQWEEDIPDFDFGVAQHPVPNRGDSIPLNYSPDELADPYAIYAGSEFKEVAADIFSYLGSLEGQRAWSSLAGGVGTPPILTEVREEARENASPQGRKALELGEQIVRAPHPIVRNPDYYQVSLEMETITPSFGEVIQGIYVGDIENPEKALRELKDRSEQELERAIGAAREKGANVSRDDWVFPNWDPRQPYTQEDYEQL